MRAKAIVLRCLLAMGGAAIAALLMLMLRYSIPASCKTAGDIDGVTLTPWERIDERSVIECADSYRFEAKVLRNGKDIPLSVVQTKSKNSPNLYLIWLVGGPNSSSSIARSRGIYGNFITQLARNGITTVAVGYAGTGSRSYFPSPNLREAIDDVGQIVEFLKKQDPNSRISIYGESLGGYVAIKFLASDPRSKDIRKYVLVSPLVLSPKEAFNELSRIAGPGRYTYEKINAFSRFFDGDLYLGQREELSSDIFIKFFDDDYLNKSLTSNDLLGHDGVVFSPRHDDVVGNYNVHKARLVWSLEEIHYLYRPSHDPYSSIIGAIDLFRMEKEIRKSFE